MRNTSPIPVTWDNFFFLHCSCWQNVHSSEVWSWRPWAGCGGTPLHSSISVGFAGDYHRPVGWASYSLGAGRPHPLALGSDLLFARCSLETNASPCCASSESTRLNPSPLQTLPPGAMPTVIQNSSFSTGELLSDRAVVCGAGKWAARSWAYLPVPSGAFPCLDASRMALFCLWQIADPLHSV